ncbi:hypothetical protein FHG87_007615 [Trinorchestia longiramus]|nr:hypothetical protein FHG87_007615 [Trinorchestia longiramus]
MFGMNVMAWNGGDLEKLEVLLNRIGHLAIGTPKCMAVEAIRGDLGMERTSGMPVEDDLGMRYLVGLDKECNMTVVDALKNFLVHAWNK